MSRENLKINGQEIGKQQMRLSFELPLNLIGECRGPGKTPISPHSKVSLTFYRDGSIEPYCKFLEPDDDSNICQASKKLSPQPKKCLIFESDLMPPIENAIDATKSYTIFGDKPPLIYNKALKRIDGAPFWEDGHEPVYLPLLPSRVFETLLENKGQTLSYDYLYFHVWGDKPPVSAETTLQTYVLHLRKILNDTQKQGRKLIPQIIKRNPIGGGYYIA